MVSQVGHHSVEDARIELGRGRVIEVDALVVRHGFDCNGLWRRQGWSGSKVLGRRAANCSQRQPQKRIFRAIVMFTGSNGPCYNLDEA